MTDIYKDLQTILMSKAERIYREFIDANGVKTNPSSPIVRIYDPNGSRVASAVPAQESTGVYYYAVDLDSSNPEGMYQAFWEGTIGSAFVTMDIPQYFWLQKVPWHLTEADSIIQSIRRMIGDTNPNNYQIATQDMYYYLSDAIDAVQAQYNMGYVVTITPTSLTFNKAVTRLARNLFKIKCAEIILTSVLFDVLFDGANLNLGDIKINMKDTLNGRREVRKELKGEFDDLVKSLKMDSNVGYRVNTYLYSRYGEV